MYFIYQVYKLNRNLHVWKKKPKYIERVNVTILFTMWSIMQIMWHTDNQNRLFNCTIIIYNISLLVEFWKIILTCFLQLSSSILQIPCSITKEWFNITSLKLFFWYLFLQAGKVQINLRQGKQRMWAMFYFA